MHCDTLNVLLHFINVAWPLVAHLLCLLAFARLMSDEVLECEWDQTSETGSHGGGDKKKPSDSGKFSYLLNTCILHVFVVFK